MILKRIKRKLYKALHPAVGEIWMLHRVVEIRSENPNQRSLEVTPEWLEGRIKEYQKRGYSFVSIDEIANKRRWVCITFDDGYQDNYTVAYPLLKRLGVPFVVYVSTGFIDNKLPMWWYPGESLGISSEDLRAMDSDSLCTVGAHTVTHVGLDTLSYDEQFREIVDSKQDLERILGHSVLHFSFPHGAHNSDTLTLCQKQGFHTAVQSWGGKVRCGSNFYSLPRINILEP